MPTTMKITSVTMRTHHTQLKETTECNNRYVVATASGPINIKLVGSIIMSCFVFFVFSWERPQIPISQGLRYGSTETQPTFQVDFYKLLHPKAPGELSTHSWGGACPWSCLSTREKRGLWSTQYYACSTDSPLCCQKPGRNHCAWQGSEIKSSWRHIELFIILERSQSSPPWSHRQCNPIPIGPGRKPKNISEKQ